MKEEGNETTNKTKLMYTWKQTKGMQCKSCSMRRHFSIKFRMNKTFGGGNDFYVINRSKGSFTNIFHSLETNTRTDMIVRYVELEFYRHFRECQLF